MISNQFSPVALAPDWLLPRQQQRELLSERRQTRASGPGGHGLAAAGAPPQTPNPEQDCTRKPNRIRQTSLHQLH